MASGEVLERKGSTTGRIRLVGAAKVEMPPKGWMTSYFASHDLYSEDASESGGRGGGRDYGQCMA
jgi:hypothetical protein